jgi:hypothetical protein
MKIRLLKHFWILAAFAILVCAPARSAGPESDIFKATIEEALVGGESELTTSRVAGLQYGKTNDDQARPENRAYRDQWAKIMRARCKQRGDCKVEAIKKDYWENDKIVRGKTRLYRINYNDGWWYEVDVDVGVIEVRHKPSTLPTLERLKKRMQKDIWDVGRKELGLTILPENATHNHIGVKATFGNDLRKIRNYLVDCANHQEVGLLTTDDLYNAPPLSKIGRHQFAEFEKVIDELDAGKITSVPDLEEQLGRRVFNRTFDMDMLGEYDHAQKYQATNTTRMNRKFRSDERTVEHRDQPGVSSAEDYLRWVRLRVRRAAYINSLEGTIKLHKFNPDASPTALVSNFYGMIKEDGLKWKDYRKFLRKKYRSVKPKQYVPTSLESDPAICVREKVREIYFKSHE